MEKHWCSASHGAAVPQRALTVIAPISLTHESELRDLVGERKPELEQAFGQMKGVHYATLFIVPKLLNSQASLVLETNYDGDEGAHLEELENHAGQLFEAIYKLCDGYEPHQLKQYLKSKSTQSQAFFIAFPGRSVADIDNAIEVHEETNRYLDRRQADPTLTLDGESRQRAFADLVHYFRFRSKVRPQDSPVTQASLRNRVLLNSFWLIPFAIPLVSIVAIFCCITRLLEKTEPQDSKIQELINTDPTHHPETHDGMDIGPQNHLCTLALVIPNPLRRGMLKFILWLVRLTARHLYIEGNLGAMSTIHFARWTLIDRDATVMFLSNYDGSWSSYLADFSDGLQGSGVNAIWSHTVGFPPTRWMLWGGARILGPYQDRVVQSFQPPLFFYKAYSNQTVNNIRGYLNFRDQLADAIAVAERREKSFAPGLQIDRDDVQGIVASGYAHLSYASYIFLRVTDTQSAKQWLASIADSVTTARHPGEQKSHRCLNLALTYSGLTAIVPAKNLHGFSYEFVNGMNRPEAALILGDTYTGASCNWKFGGDKTDEPHLLLMLYAATEPDLEAFGKEVQRSEKFADAFSIVAQQNSGRAPDDLREPFGFRDGISQPEITGLTARPRSSVGNAPVAAGEFLLGYENELGNITEVPSIDRGSGANQRLADDPGNCGRKLLGRNGTYLVYRKLAQDVEGFEKFINHECERSLRRLHPELLKAKLMGRWPSGAPLVLSPHHDDSRLAGSNDFLFANDPDGIACPIGGHIRRANPRDSLPFTPAKSLQLSQRHRIIRRGRKYAENATTPEGERQEVGLCFIALNADIRRQFEFIQETWLNSPTFNGLDGDSDPIVGNLGSDTRFTIQADPANLRLGGLNRFVKMSGGGYFFLPGISALKFLATYKEARPSGDPVS
jgi:Dyp-type peroxidase family